MSLSILRLHPAYELYDKIRDAEISRAFIASILYEAYNSDDQDQVEEFSAKLTAIDNEIKTLIEKA